MFIGLKKVGILLLSLLVLQIASCSFNKVADYDRQTADKIIEVYRMINVFYLNMTKCDPQDRQYSKFSDEYERIEIELQVLVLMNEMRSKNEDSTKQAKCILDLWIKYKNAHQEKDSYKDVIMLENLNTLNKNLKAMAKGEDFKKD